MTTVYPSLDEELGLARRGYKLIAGLDEAGRGAWAGPVVAAAAILTFDDPDLLQKLEGVRDSKLCTTRQRDELYDRIRQVSLAWAVGAVPASHIDRIGIVSATREAMQQALLELRIKPDALLIDALSLPALDLPQRSIVKGDLKSLSVAAASILAKVTRDRAMIALEESHPGYGFARHKGYGTPQHRAALYELGLAAIHRRSFRPMSAIVAEATRTPGAETGST